MSNVPSFPGCSTCGDSSTPIQTVPVPYCGQQESTDACASQKGKFHDRLTDSFIVPKVGRQSKLHVCDARLWAKHQWVGVSNGADKITVYPIMEIGNKTITVLNGCRSGEEIFGNAEAGKEFVEGTVIYPVPPQGCDSNFCERIAEALRTCGVDAVLEVLRTSDEICFTTVPELEETERGHIFVGTMPDPCNCPEEYGFGEGVGGVNQDPDNLWRSCLRKLTKIFTNLGGKTFCFSDMPIYSKLADPDRVATTVVLNQKGCLSKGESLYGCEEALDVSSEGADAISVCSNGDKKIIIAQCGHELVACCDEDDENPKWKSRPKGLSLYMLDTPIEIHRVTVTLEGEDAGSATPWSSNINVTNSFAEALIPDSCGTEKIYALVDLFWKTSNTDPAITVDIYYNDEFYRKLMTVDSSGNPDISSWSFQDRVPLDLATPNAFKFRATKVQGDGNYRSLVRILGFYA